MSSLEDAGSPRGGRNVRDLRVNCLELESNLPDAGVHEVNGRVTLRYGGIILRHVDVNLPHGGVNLPRTSDVSGEGDEKPYDDVERGLNAAVVVPHGGVIDSGGAAAL